MIQDSHSLTEVLWPREQTWLPQNQQLRLSARVWKATAEPSAHVAKQHKQPLSDQQSLQAPNPRRSYVKKMRDEHCLIEEEGKLFLSGAILIFITSFEGHAALLNSYITWSSDAAGAASVRRVFWWWRRYSQLVFQVLVQLDFSD